MKRFFAKAARFFWSWGFLKLVLWSTTLAVFLYVEEDWRGARMWAATKAKWEARGISFDFQRLIPPPVPDDQNLAAIPLFKMEPDPKYRGYLAPFRLRRNYALKSDTDPLYLGDWRHGKLPEMQKVRKALEAQYSAEFPGQSPLGDLMSHYATLYPFVGELRKASGSRPFCHFEQSYKFDPPDQTYLSLVTAQIGVSQALTTDAAIALDAGQSGQALDDIKVNAKLVRGLMDQPILVSGLVSIGMMAINLGAVYKGLAEHRWNDEQLAEIQREAAQLDYLAHFQRLMRGEAVGLVIPAIDRIKTLRSQEVVDPDSGKRTAQSSGFGWPSGWLDIWKAQSVDLDFTASTWVDPKGRRVWPDAMKDDQLKVDRHLESWAIYLPWNWLFRVSSTEHVFKVLEKFAQGQVWVDETRIACALERYRLAEGKYPASLDGLVPKCIDALPHDVMSGEAYRYRLNADGTFLLYSVGWNQTDEGGKAVDKFEGGQRDYEHGDWVWPTRVLSPPS